ncbi:hypothetical protein N665_1796s0001 [Sinapis alba]|nr:hypothetical protein N665_1796s0001 [Sinapis alba]
MVDRANDDAGVINEHKLLLEAMTRCMEQMMDTKLDAFRQENQQSDRRNHQRRNKHNHQQEEHAGSEETDNYYERISFSSRHSQRRERNGREGRRFQRDELAGLKLKIPPFHGKADLDAYLEWEKKIELVFHCQQLKRKGHSRSTYGESRFQGPKEEKPSYQQEIKPYQKEETKPNSSRARDVKYFKCQGRGHYENECTNKRVMILLDNDEIESEDEREDMN